jgi:hypothetical protein
MKTVLSGLMATALAASFAVVLPISANAAPVSAPVLDVVRGDVVNVGSDRYWKYPRASRDFVDRRQNRWERRRAWRYRDRYHDDGYYDDRYYDEPVYRSYRAYKPRRYYRRHRPGVTLEFNLN